MQEFELKIIISLITIGFVGGFSHCAFMCGPFVMMQVNNNLKKISIDNLNHFTRLKGLALIPYHLGRITTYSFLGFFSSLFGKNIKNHTNSHLISAILLFLAALIVFNLILKNYKLKLLPSFKKTPKINSDFFLLKKFTKMLKKITKPLFNKPEGFNGYFLGIILGFIPCGLLYSALLIVANINNQFLAMFSMFIFGLCTIPALFLVSFGNYLFFNKLKNSLKIFIQFILLINMITLIIISAYEIKLM